MTKRTTHHGYYVTAMQSPDGLASRVAWLVGPFETQRAAQRMVQAVSHVCRHNHSDPRFAFAAFGTARLTHPISQPLPPGRLDIAPLIDETYINYIVYK